MRCRIPAGLRSKMSFNSGLLVLAFTALIASVAAEDWVDARATFYGLDAWSLHNGACGFGYTCDNRWSSQLAQGWDVAAISDRSNLNTGSQCGCVSPPPQLMSISNNPKNVSSNGCYLRSVHENLANVCHCNHAHTGNLLLLFIIVYIMRQAQNSNGCNDCHAGLAWKLNAVMAPLPITTANGWPAMGFARTRRRP